MDELVNKSLARKSVQSDSDITTTWYSVHNLQLTYLREQIGKKAIELHVKLVLRYKEVYDGKGLYVNHFLIL